MNLNRWIGRFKEAARRWSKDDAPMLGAALSYYALFSVAPLVVIAVAIAGLVFGSDAARGRVETELQQYMGDEVAKSIQAMIAAVAKPKTGTLAVILGIGTLFVGAIGAFLQLTAALSRIWNFAPRTDGDPRRFVKNYALAFGMMIGVGLMLIASLAISAILAGISGWSAGLLPISDWLWRGVEKIVSLALLTLAFAAIFKATSPFEWHDLWAGAIVTSLLFALGKFAFGLYIEWSGVQSAYGAAGGLVAFVIWVYYSAQIFFFGAELVDVCADETKAKVTERG